jgi:hypothetical protein
VANMNLTALRAASSADSTIFIPRLIESPMQEVYRESSYYENGTCGHADTRRAAQEPAPKRGLTIFRPLRIDLSRCRLN